MQVPWSDENTQLFQVLPADSKVAAFVTLVYQCTTSAQFTIYRQLLTKQEKDINISHKHVRK